MRKYYYQIRNKKHINDIVLEGLVDSPSIVIEPQGETLISIFPEHCRVCDFKDEYYEIIGWYVEFNRTDCRCARVND